MRKFRCPRCPFVPSTPTAGAELKTTADWVRPGRRLAVTNQPTITAPGSSLVDPDRVVVGAGAATGVSRSQRKAQRRRAQKQQPVDAQPQSPGSSVDELAAPLVVDTSGVDSASVTAVDEPEGPCFVERLDADTLLQVFSYMATTDLLSLAAAYSFAAQLVSDANIVAAREIRCFVTKKTAGQTLLGIGLRWNSQLKGLESSFDWLSREAWTDLEIRMGIKRDVFTHWLPLAIHDGHFRRARKEIVTRLQEIERKLVLGPGKGGAGRRDPSVDGYRALCSFANEIIVRLMKTADDVLATQAAPEPLENNWGGCDCEQCMADRQPKSTKPEAQSPAGTLLHASEKALCDFISVIHLAVALAASNPAIARDAAGAVHRFIRYNNARAKSTTPDLGELLVQMALCSDVGWSELRGPLVQEALTRNVVWMLDSRQGKGLAALAFLEGEPVSEWRLKTTFEASRTSLRLLMFQHAFLSQLPLLCGSRARPGRMTVADLKDGLDARYGLPPPDMPGRLVQSIKDIYSVRSPVVLVAFFSLNDFAGRQLCVIRDPARDAVAQQAVDDQVPSRAHPGVCAAQVPRSACSIQCSTPSAAAAGPGVADRTPERRKMKSSLRQSDATVSRSFFPR